jgi:Protein of unknown function (DUF4246)
MSELNAAHEGRETIVPFTLPGFTEPLDFISNAARTEWANYTLRSIYIPPSGSGRDMFPNALCPRDLECRSRLPLTTRREFLMLQFMNEVTDKLNWDVKAKDDTITEKWRQEALQQDNFTDRMAMYCIEELRWRAGLYQKTGFVFVYNGNVVKSDTAVSAELKSRLQAAVSRLENIPKKEKDYHPNSNEQVWNLVHPSLFPLLYGTSRILRDETIGLSNCWLRCGAGEIVPVPPEPQPIRGQRSAVYSTKFQWLPCDVQMSAPSSGSTGIKCTICSYINNLHPEQHKDLYSVIEDVIAACVPLWNETLLCGSTKQRIPYSRVEYRPEAYEEYRHFPHADPEDFNVSDDEYGSWIEELRLSFLIHPEPEAFQTPEQGKAVSREVLPFVEQFHASGLQVIVKLATIELTPEKPSYNGGTWHVEGQLNEHICASALYYYSSENITESRLGFRQMCVADVDTLYGGGLRRVKHEQDDHTFLQAIFGCNNEEAAVQEIGSVFCKEGRLITFPNTLQHRVLPFALADSSKSGHRKILALFLVDPNLHVISTSSIPPQRQDWWSDKVYEGGGFGGLNEDLQERVVSMMDFPLSMDQALASRLELMEERTTFETGATTNFLQSVEFSLCEH